MEPPSSLPAMLLLLLCSGAAAFRICAFNAQRFAQGKVNKPRVVDILVKILARCDISVLQEVMDAKGKAVPALMNALHQFDDLHSYSYLTSPLLGRGNYQERYVYIYRNQKTQILDYYTYEDMHPDRPDVFAREPFIARFSMANKELPELVLIPQHTMPSKAEAEIDALYDVFLNVQERWATETVDMWPRNVGKTSACVRNLAFIGSLGTKLTPLFERRPTALEISDHYPVEVELVSSCKKLQPASLAGLVLLIIVVISDSRCDI
ncbi:deoxyribonuclease-1-like 1 isoform X3 [Ahaetulla prasina]|uniref:deoxyribonuclease-1-like 1 isoform X3 n=1 Tax=Ahaetulla prasina TaxID=499056 RepID=UPI002648773F|nr:deoxyribonuclease-1-like 1 isoform X3 [Ahaetulla prasina]